MNWINYVQEQLREKGWRRKCDQHVSKLKVKTRWLALSWSAAPWECHEKERAWCTCYSSLLKAQDWSHSLGRPGMMYCRYFFKIQFKIPYLDGWEEHEGTGGKSSHQAAAQPGGCCPGGCCPHQPILQTLLPWIQRRGSCKPGVWWFARNCIIHK